MEIRERHRQLSIVFHPDKQRDDESRASATKFFYEIQRAYEGEFYYSFGSVVSKWTSY
ncbi:J domain-containing protein [Neisseria sp. P0017.S002]|uniref:J domain-containing protein n=1 Tax=Neisseria sp. P0017.S002 TaxID=3436778 RepID=UPI003F7EB4D5